MKSIEDRARDSYKLFSLLKLVSWYEVASLDRRFTISRKPKGWEVRLSSFGDVSLSFTATTLDAAVYAALHAWETLC